jgi:feruloyl esterase
MVPGMGHCSGGAGPNSFGQGNDVAAIPRTPERNVFRALMAWSERGVEPQAITATRFVNNNATLAVERTRPLCNFPLVARYKGTGSTDDAANFSCVAP